MSQKKPDQEKTEETPPKSEPTTSSTTEEQPPAPTVLELLEQAREQLQKAAPEQEEQPPSEEALIEEIEKLLVAAGKKPEPPSVEESMEALAKKLRDTSGMFEDLIDLVVNDPDFIPPEVRISKDDIVILYNVQLINGSKTLMHLKGRQDLPMALHESQLNTTLRKFQTVFAAVIGEPLSGRLQHLLTTLAVDEDDEPFMPAEEAPIALPPGQAETDNEDSSGGFIAPTIPDEPG